MSGGQFITIQTCRACGAGPLIQILFLGNHPLANELKASAADPQSRYPLTLLFCGNCSLVQIAETIDKERLFGTYVWVTGTSSAARQFAREFCRMARQVRFLGPGDLVVEIASNDGTFLRPFLEQGCRVIGVDPATNIARLANEQGLPTVNEFWNARLAASLVAEHGPARLVCARNVIAHASELHDMLEGIRLALADDGIAAVEFHSALHILEGLQYDSIYHEHLCYFSALSFERLLARHGLHPVHAEFSPISGGASIIYFSRSAAPPSTVYRALLERERLAGVDLLAAWQAFAVRCERHRQQSREMARTVAGRTVVGFGASARSSTYLNFCGFSGSELAAIIDNSALKWNRFSPGSSIRIVSPDEGFALRPELVLVLAWNFRDEIIAACRARGFGGALLIPFPNEPKMVENYLGIRT